MKPELAESLGISDDLITFTKAQGTSRAGVVIAITVPFSQTTYDAIYRLLDIGQFAVYNSRVPGRVCRTCRRGLYNSLFAVRNC